MNLKPTPIRLPRWIAGDNRRSASAGEPPFRAELFGVEQLSRHAASVAAGHQTEIQQSPNSLLTQLEENEKILRAFNRGTVAVDKSRKVTPAAEWLLDNFHLIEEQIQMARRHLPRNYSYELPRLKSGQSIGLPRVYDIVLEFITHVDAQVDSTPLTAFISAYQAVSALALGELWAIPIMLRLGLIENLQRITTRLMLARQDRDRADMWVDRLQEMVAQNPSLLVVVVGDMAKSDLSLSSSFVAEFCQRLSRQDPILHIARSWLEQRLVQDGLSVEQLIHSESQTQAADQVSVSHSITSLRFLSALDWKEFVEGLSAVDHTLRGDPADVYSDMDFATRDRYRHVVETIARHSGLVETDVAARAVQIASEHSRVSGRTNRTAHVGFYLIDKGRPELERALNVRRPWSSILERMVQRYPLSFYVGGILFLTALSTLAFVQQARAFEVHGWKLLAFSLLFVVAVSQLAVALMNWLASLLVKPSLLPRLDYTLGIPPDRRTMVVVPTMITSVEGVDRLVETLEIHHLANRDASLHFALLTDFRDATTEAEPDDNLLIERVQAGIEMLNQRFPLDQHSRFFLFHRPRRWNAAEGQWMGYERKRGKLTEFNSLLRGAARECFSVTVGNLGVLPSIKYVITLDTDTQLPRDSARQLVATMAHPLNRPEFDPVRGVVCEGYGILQPRVGASLPSADRSLFVRLFAGDVGIDPYTRAVSNVYQDVFGEGSFIGKGIYDVDAFERALAGRFPENTVLSHDLLESAHVRSGLVSDLEFYEDFPSQYSVDVARRHRWIRGDWQIWRWLLSRVPAAGGQRTVNPLSSLSQWKIFDNLRRSLTPVSLLALLIGSWMWLTEVLGLGSLVVLSIVVLPGLMAAMVTVFEKSSELPWRMHLRAAAESCGRHLGQIFLAIAFLPYDAFLSLDAISRTWVRLVITHRRLLEWRTSSETERTSRTDLMGFYRTMWIAPTVAIGVGAVLVQWQAGGLYLALPFLGLWFFAPAIAWWISRPISRPKLGLSDEQHVFLRHTARKTWHFFETFVTAQENWLPPDNFQEIPAPTIASRTSPTNIGLALLANLAARDFGYLSVGGLIERTAATLATVQRLERHRGHLYNWYDTRSLQPLHPLYVSSVDSGNLAGHLLTLGSGLRELADESILDAQAFRGMRDTVEILVTLGVNSPALTQLADKLLHLPPTLTAASTLLESAAACASDVTDASSNGNEETKRWTAALQRSCQEHLAELRRLSPWLPFASAASGASGNVATAALAEKLKQLQLGPSLREVAELEGTLAPLVEAALNSISTVDSRSEGEEKDRLTSLLRVTHEASDYARQRLAALEMLAAQSDERAEMDFSFLFDSSRELLTIGYNVTDRRRDTSYYDLLASEARLGSYVMIAQGQAPQDHWFSLSRLLVEAQGEPILVSWSGSMFEYLMPLLVMPNYENTLLAKTCEAAVRQQIKYGAAQNIPWGISESGYNLTDVHLNYQYRAFGVPGLGLKRGLGDDSVIAPYATAMALMVAPRAACENLQRLAAEGQEGAYGFYEAVDYTPSRMPPGETTVTIRSFMAHHQGMSLLALVYLLRDRPMQRRFLACAALKATDLLLQERVPRATANVVSGDLTLEEVSRTGGGGVDVARVLRNPAPPTPEVHLLSNGRYHVAVSSAGGGYSRWRDLALTRWREDATRDCWGTFIYLRDVDTDEFWSATHQPTRRASKRYEAIFTQGRAEFRDAHGELEAHTEIAVSPEDDVELRRITLVNRSSKTRVMEVTSFAEVVLAPAGADASHPAFSNLFVQTEFVPNVSAILCTRRARSPEEKPPWLMHVMVSRSGDHGDVSYETDRSRFVGRGESLSRPAAVQRKGALSNTVGPVLDPIISLRRIVTLPAGERAIVDLIIGAAETKESAVALAEKYQQFRVGDRAFDLAWTHSQVTLRHLNATEAEAQLYSRLASALIYADPGRRAVANVLRTNRRGQSGLWSYGVSGDLPLVLLHIGNSSKIEILRQMIQAHAYWRMKGLVADLVIVNEDVSVYRQSLHDDITRLISSGLGAQLMEKAGGIFVRRLEQIPQEDRVLLHAVARIVLSDENGTLSEQLQQRSFPEIAVAALTPTRRSAAEAATPLPERELTFQNGLGGFTRDGHEYVITLQAGQVTPAPWVNVLANPSFGTVVSESGSAYTWLENAHEFRLTPWNNDPVQDTCGEAVYIRDELSGEFWSPTPAPARGATPYVIRHGFGYTVFEHTENGIASELWVYVAIDAPVKFTVLKLRNVSGRPRRLSATAYWEWVLGDLRSKNLLHVQTELDSKTGALLARNYYNTEFPERVAFVDVTDTTRTMTGDRREFIGAGGGLEDPAALKRTRLSGRVGAGLDPCAALQVPFDLAAGQEREVTFRLGAGRSTTDAQDLVQRFRSSTAGRTALERVWDYWNRTLGAVNVDTPDPAVNVMANGWLLYQTLSCRIWGRTGFYQSGGAYGFRDQLQDVMAMVHAEPALAREHLLRAAAQQFREGDVQHWWHPPSGRGVRTRFSDDYLWLPYVTCRYVSCVGDSGVLEEKIHFLNGRQVRPGDEAYYDLPQRSEESATLYEHCVRAIENGFKFGAHGLPLIGCGDWNDGMNMVGREGRGESVWLAFFLFDVLNQFAALARSRNDSAFADRCLEQAGQLQKNIEREAWDGAWYRRAYFDNGEPLGSQSNIECQIDSLPQSWSVISGAGNAARSRDAMASVNQRLIRRDAQLIQLFDPPFDHAPLNPGYIKGYIPGVRENGGQYTHGAIWTTMAFALMGETERAWELFSMLNPVNHGSTPEKIATYKVEPYVVAADVYAVPPHTGRGGWTWYTGSAGWMYRLLVETLLGVNREGDRLRLEPRFPTSWPCYKIHYRYRQTVYHITITRHLPGTEEAESLTVDGTIVVGSTILLRDDRHEHTVELKVRTHTAPPPPS